MNAPLTAVFDTNILFSAIGWRGKPFECVEQARMGKVQAEPARIRGAAGA